jgi:hypothetical protein
MDFISGLYNLYLKDRFGEIRNYGQESSDIQSEQLSNLLLEASDTEWGKMYDFKTIFSYQEFRERLPVQHLSDLNPYLDRMKKGEANLLWPGLPKDIIRSLNNTCIPIFLQAVEEIFQQGIEDSYAIYSQEYPGCRLFEGFSANIGNGEKSTCLDELNAVIRENEPFLTSLLNIPKRVGANKDGNLDLVLKETLGQKVTSFCGTLDRLGTLLDIAREKTGKESLKDIWPEAEILFERGVSTTQKMLERLHELPEGLKFQASYMSPEGFFGIQDKPGDSAFLLMLDLSTFYEFIPLGEDESRIIPLEDITLGADYKLVLTNCNGLWRCCSEGPHLRFVTCNPYRFILL